jgi:hypothetical protein
MHTVNEIYNQVVEELEVESDDSIITIAANYGILAIEYTREQLIDRIASMEVESYVK